MSPQRTRGRLPATWLIGVATCLLSLAACSGTEPAPSERPSTTVQPATSQAATTATATTVTATAAPAETSSTAAATVAPSIGFEFRRESAETEAYIYEISYPALLHPDPTIADAVNSQLENWVATAIDELAARSAPGGSKSTFSAQIAPELISESIFSLSGVTFIFVSGEPTSVSGRVGWVFALESGDRVDAADLFIDGQLNELAAAARTHLISDVLGDETAIIAPDGLLPEPDNFDAVWLTTTGVGVGFDQFQVAAGDAGSPAVLISFAELDTALDKSGVLRPLQDGDTLPGG